MASSRLSRFVDRTRQALSRESHTPSQAIRHPQGLEVVAEGNNPIVDIVALHGLNGHREKTWTAENGVHWLRDLLPDDLPQARILCWGYDANTHAADRVSWQYLYDHARTLVSDLCRKRKMTNSIERPIIFVAHSLGGLVLKSALIHSDAARQRALPEHRSIKLSTYGIVFMGTPHQGGNGVQLGQVLANVASLVIAADTRLLKHLERDSEWLQQQLGQYGPISNEFVTKFAYEEYKTPTVLGKSIMVVPRASAVVPGHADAEPIVIHANHTSMVRYISRLDEGYVTVSEHLQLMVKDATENVRKRWEEEARVDDARGNVNHFTVSLSLSEVAVTSHFVGREEELAWIHRELSKSPGGHTAVVHGLGGMGKTQLAIAYMKRHRNDYSASIWLNARNETSLKQSFRLAATRIAREHPGLGYMQTAASDKDEDASLAVRRWLDEPKNDQWLLIYDNYDHPKMVSDTNKLPNGAKPGHLDQRTPESYDIRQYLPDTASDSGAILITTRSSSVNVGQMIPLKKLRNIDDSLQILTLASCRPNLKEDPSATKLSKLLDGLPLALASAGAYLKGLTTSCAEYIDLYKQEWSALHQRPQGLLSEEKTLYSTWNISYEYIKTKNENAVKLLQLWSYFDNNDLWYELLRDGKEPKQQWHQDTVLTRLAFDSTMRILCSHSLVDTHADMPTKESQGYNVHTCVHEWMTNVLNRNVDSTMIHRAVDCIASHVPFNDEPQFWLTQRRLLAHADRCLALEASSTVQAMGSNALFKLGLLYADQARHKEAETIYQRALKGYEKTWGPDHTSTLDTVNNLGLLYMNQGRLKEAEAMYQRALKGKEKVWGSDHTSTLSTVNNLGNLYAEQARHQEAEAMYQRALEGKEKAWGPDHTSTLDTVNNLGALYADQGRLKEAEAMYQRALEGKEKAWGPDHTSTLRTVNNLGALYANQGRLKEAEAMYQRALKGQEKAWGPDHTSTLDTMNNLGALYADQGRLKEAEAMYQRALEGKEKAWGPDHTSTLDTVNNLGLFYMNQGRLKEAEAMYQRALEGYEKAWGPDHTSTLDTVNNLGLLYMNQGRLKEAEAMYQRALEGKEKVWGSDHTSTLDTVNNLGNLYMNQGRLKEAEAMYQRALEGYEKTWGPDHTSTLDTVNNLGALYANQGRLKEAEAMYQRALKGQEKAWGPDHTSTLDTMNNLGNLYAEQARHQEAETIYQRALKGYEKTWGPDHTSTLDTVNNLGLLYMNQGRLKEAEAMYQRALKGQEKAWGPDHTSTLDAVHNLGLLYKNQGRLKEAEAMYQRALEGYEKTWGPDHTSTLDTVNNLGNLYMNQGRLKEAEAMYQRATRGIRAGVGYCDCYIYPISQHSGELRQSLQKDGTDTRREGVLWESPKRR